MNKSWTIGDRVTVRMTPRKTYRAKIVRFGTGGLPGVTRPVSSAIVVHLCDGPQAGTDLIVGESNLTRGWEP